MFDSSHNGNQRMTDHGQGALLTGSGLAVSVATWFVSNITTINSFLQFFVLLMSAIAALIGVRKLIR